MNKLNNLHYTILGFGILKLLIHFLTNTNYGFHRDEFLYLQEGQNLGWGFMEVPPLTPFIGKIIGLLGSSVFVTRFFPALIGAITIILAGLLVKKLGGKLWAVIFCCGGLLLCPALLGSNTLFQPVSFNQFFWFISVYFIVHAVQTENHQYWYYLGISMGLGLLTKYSIVFYGLSIFIGLLLTPERKHLKTKYPYFALLIALLISSPNILWQINHNIPLLSHMSELSETQLTNMNWSIYLSSQFTFSLSFTIVWLAGLIGLFRIDAIKKYRFVGIGFITTILLIGFLSGKAYYTIGAFTILFPFGGIALEKWIPKNIFKALLFTFMTIIVLPGLPYILPVLKIEQMKKYCKYMADNYGNKGILRWEDGSYHELPQDYADMHGWEELSQRVASVYHALPEHKKATCNIWGGSYGHACSMNFYRKKYNLPEIHGMNSSCLMWIPDEMDFDNQILVDDSYYTESSWFENISVVDSIRDIHARDPGYIYYRENPKIDINEGWKNMVKEAKAEFNF